MIAYIVLLEWFSRLEHFHLASYNLIEIPMKHDGSFINLEQEMWDGYDYGLALMITMTIGRIFFTYYALYIQWNIESEFSIFTELLLVYLSWFNITFFQ